MKKVNYLATVTLCLSAGIFFMGCEPEPQAEKEAVILRMYNPEVAQAELLSLSSLDPDKLSKEELKEKTTREGDITALLKDMKEIDFLYGGISEGRRVPPPPTPCPTPWACLEPDIAIDLFELGIFLELDSLPDSHAARESVTPEPTVSIELDSQHVFALGKITTPAGLPFKTTRFHFTVVDCRLESKDLTMIITTSILKEGKPQAVEMKIPVPAHTFSAD